MQLYFLYSANFYFPHAPPFPRNIGYYSLVFFLFSHKLKKEKLKEKNIKNFTPKCAAVSFYHDFEWTREPEIDTRCWFQDVFGDEKGGLLRSKKGWSCIKVH